MVAPNERRIIVHLILFRLEFYGILALTTTRNNMLCNYRWLSEGTTCRASKFKLYELIQRKSGVLVNFVP